MLSGGCPAQPAAATTASSRAKLNVARIMDSSPSRILFLTLLLPSEKVAYRQSGTVS
jgi:hypothetical protein